MNRRKFFIALCAGITFTSLSMCSSAPAPTLREQIRNDLIRHEGSLSAQARRGFYRGGRFYAYYDSLGFRTIGYGHRLYDTTTFTDGITTEQASLLLDTDITTAERGVDRILRERNIVLNSNDEYTLRRILVNMCFQLGPTGLNKFEKMFDALSHEDYKTMKDEMLDSKWARSDSPNRARELSTWAVTLYQ